MAKGDSSRVSNEINAQRNIAQPGTTGINQQASNTYQNVMPQWQDQYQRDMSDRSNIMQGYQNFNNGLAGMSGGAGLMNQDQINSALQGYQGFANNGGYTDQNINDLRARAFAPVRAAYQQANSALQQNRGLSGGYSPNFAAATARMARQQGQQMSDAEVNNNAAIAQAVAQNKLAGLGGLSSTALQNQAAGLQASAINNQFALGRAGLGLQGLSGMSDLYRSAPGASGQLFQDVLGAQGQQLQGQGLQNNLSLGFTGARQAQSQIPSDFQQGLGNVSGVLGLAGSVAGGLSGLGGFGGLNGGALQPSSYAYGEGI